MHNLYYFTLISVCFAAPACSKGDKDAKGGGDAAACPAFSVTVDGSPVAGLTHGMAFTHKRGAELVHQVDLFNHDKTTCEQLTSRKGRQIPDGEEHVWGFSGGEGLMGDGVGVGDHTQMGLGVKLASDAPKNPGDVVAVCVPESTFSPKSGKNAGKQVKVVGLMQGKYCGIMDWDSN